MLDVIHFMLEEYMFVGSAAEIESKSKTRETIYRIFYDRPYQYGVSTGGKSNDYSDSEFYDDDNSNIPPSIAEDGFQTDEIIVPVDPNEPPIKKTHKPYVPATDFNPDSVQPFGRLIDGPLG